MLEVLVMYSKTVLCGHERTSRGHCILSEDDGKYRVKRATASCNGKLRVFRLFKK